MNPIQNPLFKEPVGMTFKIRRELLGLTLDDVSKSLKFGTHLVQAIELEQWDKLGPAIYANSYINSYIKLLELNPEIRNEIPHFKGDSGLKTIAAPRLSHSTSLPKAILALIIVISSAAVIAYLYSRNQKVNESLPSTAISMSAEIPNATMMKKNPLTQTDTAPITSPSTSITAPIDAMTPTPHTLSIHANQAINLEILDTKDAIVFSEQILANQDRTQAIENVGKIKVDNAQQAILTINGVTQDLTPFTTNGVAHFTVDKNGTIVAITQ